MKKPKLRRFVREHIAPLALVVLVLTSFRSAIADWNIVPTGSMNPSIVEGDRIFVNKLAYGLKVPFTTLHLTHWEDPARGEIVVFKSPADGLRLVKRVVALPGETVELINNRLFINGQPAAYSLPSAPAAANHPVLMTAGIPSRRTFGPFVVPAGHYFVLGDNRDNSADSRFIGAIPRNNIVGRSSAVVLSLDPENHLPRWDRTLHALP